MSITGLTIIVVYTLFLGLVISMMLLKGIDNCNKRIEMIENEIKNNNKII